MARFGWFAVFGCLAASSAHAQSAAAPQLVAAEMWTYSGTTEVGSNFRQVRTEITIDHASGSSIAFTQRTLDSNTPARQMIANSDWSRSRSVNGRQTVVNRPLDFPLRVGKSWTIDYSEDNPNREHASEHVRTPYKVVGWDDITVPAGTFHALKIEAEGEWSAALPAAVTAGAVARADGFGTQSMTQTNRVAPSTASGRTYKAFWYVPAVKRWVKSVEEYYSSTGQRTTLYKEELLSYKTAGEGGG